MTESTIAPKAAPHLRAHARRLEGLRHEIVIGDGRHVLFTDEPAALGGDDSAPAPHELLPAALAACISTTLAAYARTRDWPIGDVAVDVDYDHRSTPRRFTVAIHLGRELSPEQVARLEKVAAACPVRRAIEAGMTFDEHVVLDAVSVA